MSTPGEVLAPAADASAETAAQKLAQRWAAMEADMPADATGEQLLARLEPNPDLRPGSEPNPAGLPPLPPGSRRAREQAAAEAAEADGQPEAEPAPEGEAEAAPEVEPEEAAPWSGTLEELIEATGVDAANVIIRRQFDDQLVETTLAEALGNYQTRAELEASRARAEAEFEQVRRHIGARAKALEHAVQEAELAAQVNATVVQQMEASLNAEYANLPALRHTMDPGEWAAHAAAYQQKLGEIQRYGQFTQMQLGQARQAYEQNFERANAERLREERTQRIQVQPTWADEATYQRARGEFTRYIRETYPWVSDEMIAAETSPVIESLAWKAMQYDAAEKRRREIEQRGPGTVRALAPGGRAAPSASRQGRVTQEARDLAERARQSGRAEDAAARLSHRWANS